VLESHIGNFLIRIEIGDFYTVCPYERPDTLIRWDW